MVDNDNEFYIPRDLKNELGNTSGSFHLSKMDNDLFKEDNNVINTVFRVKRKETKKSGESWHIFSDDLEILEIKAYRLSKAEKEFFRGVEGIKFLLECAKNNVLTVVKVKEALKLKDKK